MLKNSEKKNKKKIIDSTTSPSLKQGNKFDNYQNKIKNSLEKNKNLSVEGFENIKGLDLQANGLTNQTKNVIDQNQLTPQQQQSLNELTQEYQNTLTEYENLLNQINGTTTGYLNRVSPNNPYLGKTVGFTGGQIAYVTQQGVLKYIPSTQIQQTLNIPKTITPLNIPWNNSYSTPGTSIPTNPSLISGTPAQSGQSFGNEGSNVYVDQLLPSNVNPTYMGCYATNSSNNNMTFIGGSPVGGNLQNGNFTQPQIANNSYQYITSNSVVPNWAFSAVLINNSTDWGYPMPYPYGPQAACIQAGQSFAQWIQLNSGSYNLSFNACGRPGYSGANTISVYCVLSSNFTTVQAAPSIYTFTPPTSSWQSYTIPFNLTSNGNYFLGFIGTINNPNNSTAIQNIQLTTTGQTSGGTYTYSQCEQAAINGGYQFFALQNVNTNTSKGYCAVTNSEPAVTQFGQSMIPTKLNVVWSSNTSGQTGNTAILNVSGSLQVINSGGQAIFSTPNSSAQPSNYLGCYGDGPNRAMTGLVTGGSQQYNLQQCQQIAQQQGATYFGLQNSTSGTTAQCFLSSNWAQTTQYGKAGNCTQVSGGSWSGGGYSNAVYNTTATQSNYILIINDNGIAVQRGTSPTDNQGTIWSLNFTKQQFNPNYVASSGKYGQNWITQGQTLAAGDWVGSPNGYAALIMQSTGNLTLVTFQMQTNCQKMSDGNIGGGVGGNAAYNIGITSKTGNLGNLAYIDANSEIHTYPSSNQTYSNNYMSLTSMDSPGNDIPGASFSGSQKECQSTCNSNPNCAGYVTNSSGSYCWPKTNSMYPNSKNLTYNSDKNTYVRKKMPKSPPIGVSQNTNNIDTVTYQNYINGGAISNAYGLSKATAVQQQQITQLETQLNLLAQQISQLNGQYKTGVNVLEKQSSKNVKGIANYLTNLITTDLNISSTTEMNNGNLQNILSDSDIIVLQKNYTYLAWSILAAGTVLVTMNVVKK